MAVSQLPRRQQGFITNSDLSKLMSINATMKGYRYSKFSNYWVLDAKTKETQPLHPQQKSNIAYAKWSPTDPNVIAFVMENNIYLWKNGTVIQVTENGSPTLYHGVPDWVYEEEVLESNSALWFSPDGEYIAFLTFDDEKVPVYTVPYYMRSPAKALPYSRQKHIRYPKPGYPNPLVSASLFKVSEPTKFIDIPITNTFPIDDLVVGEVAWLTDTHEHIMIRCFNRIQNHDKHLLYWVATGEAKILRSRNADDGWLDNTKSLKYVGKAGNSTSNDTFYVDLSDKDGWNHLYIYDVTGSFPKQLTFGQWEVRQIDKIDRKTNQVYYSSTEHHPTESHPYSVSLVTGERKPLVKAKEAAHWEASYSQDGSYVVLNYMGPEVPYQELYSTNATSGPPIRVLENNAGLTARLAEYALPKIKYMDLAHPTGVKLSAMLRFPPNFSPEKRYPVLLTPYGGPGSQQVRKTFATPDWNAYVTSDSDLEYVTFTVDNRGTGFRGRSFRNFYYKGMGTVDAEDQIWAAEDLAKKNPWVDKAHIGIWGWSNGGYIAAKVVEKNSDIISFAIATAPTSDCALYDSIYAERFMGMKTQNEAAWERAAIRNATGFRNIPGGLLIQHGTGDDNVHIAHTYTMVDMLMGAGVGPDKLQVQPFTDSDHNIQYNKDSAFMYRQLTKKLFDEKNRKPPGKVYEWEAVQHNVLTAEDLFPRRNLLMDQPIFQTKWTKTEMDFVDEIP
jgi:dipeptidyl-peptidase 4